MSEGKRGDTDRFTSPLAGKIVGYRDPDTGKIVMYKTPRYPGDKNDSIYED